MLSGYLMLTEDEAKNLITSLLDDAPFKLSKNKMRSKDCIRVIFPFAPNSYGIAEILAKMYDVPINKTIYDAYYLKFNFLLFNAENSQLVPDSLDGVLLINDNDDAVVVQRGK